MAKIEPRTARVQVYLTDQKIVSALNREARQSRVPLSQAAGQAIARGLNRGSGGPGADERMLQLERSLRDHMRSSGRDVWIVQELLIEFSRAFFMRLPDAVIDNDPVVTAAVERRVQMLIAVTAARVAAGDPRKRRAKDRAKFGAGS